ncbi:alpha/beta hydrolase [Paraburkholderia sediminicola]|uniref:alpha/beta hydrolase n=1 Tax=Paraburkholderia sediminicola TaxID=458836 RepID=UPI0038B80A3A
MASVLGRRGIDVVAVDYKLTPKVMLAEIVRQVHAAIAFLWRQGSRPGIDPEGIYLGGSSAGGHLAAAGNAAGWHQGGGMRAKIVWGHCRSAVCSGRRRLPIASSRTGCSSRSESWSDRAHAATRLPADRRLRRSRCGWIQTPVSRVPSPLAKRGLRIDAVRGRRPESF